MFIFRLGISIPNCQHSSQSPIIQPVRKHWRRRQRVTRWKTYQSSAPILPGDMSWLVLSECGWCGPGVCRVFLVFLWFLLVLFCDNHIGQLEKVNTWRYVFVWCFFFWFLQLNHGYNLCLKLAVETILLSNLPPRKQTEHRCMKESGYLYPKGRIVSSTSTFREGKFITEPKSNPFFERIGPLKLVQPIIIRFT